MGKQSPLLIFPPETEKESEDRTLATTRRSFASPKFRPRSAPASRPKLFGAGARIRKIIPIDIDKWVFGMSLMAFYTTNQCNGHEDAVIRHFSGKIAFGSVLSGKGQIYPPLRKFWASRPPDLRKFYLLIPDIY